MLKWIWFTLLKYNRKAMSNVLAKTCTVMAYINRKGVSQSGQRICLYGPHLVCPPNNSGNGVYGMSPVC